MISRWKEVNTQVCNISFAFIFYGFFYRTDAKFSDLQKKAVVKTLEAVNFKYEF